MRMIEVHARAETLDGCGHGDEDRMTLHAIVYHGKFELNRTRLSPVTHEMRLKDGSIKSLPVSRAEGIRFGYMTRGKSDFVLVKAGDVVLDTPVALCRSRHMEGKKVAPSPTSVGHAAAANLLSDAIASNPHLRTSLEALYALTGKLIPTLTISGADPNPSLPDLDLDLSDGREGTVHLQTHLVRERDRSLMKRKRKAVIAATGSLRCEVCTFDFASSYPGIGEGFCEVHHTVPLSQLDGERNVAIKDLAIVCSNCHRMLHKGKVLRTIADLRDLVLAASKRALQ